LYDATAAGTGAIQLFPPFYGSLNNYLYLPGPGGGGGSPW
jgi:hypothetical protein